MKKILIFIIVLFLPQSIFANDFSLFGSFENRGAFGKNKMPIAEGDLFKDPAALPLEIEFANSYFYKAGAGFKWRGFDIGAYYTNFSNEHDLEDKFGNTFPLSTSAVEGNVDVNPEVYGTEHVKGFAKGKYDFEHIDLDVGAVFKIEDISLRFSAGIRYGNYAQSLNVETSGARQCGVPVSEGPRVCYDPDEIVDLDDDGDETYAGPSYGNSRQLDMDIEAFGPRLGLSVGVPLSKNITFMGGVNWAVLFGSKNSSENYNHTTTRRQVAIASQPAVLPTADDPVTGAVFHAGSDFVPHVEGPPIVSKIEETSLKVVDKDTTIHNLEFEAGLRYDLEFSKTTTLSFLAGYRYDIHYGVRTTCGVSRYETREPAPGTGVVSTNYGNCAGKNSDGAIVPGNEDFISHGPFLRTTLSF